MVDLLSGSGSGCTELVATEDALTHFQGTLDTSVNELSDGETLVSWSHNNIDMWRADADINRPKWGIYRSLNDINVLRDETVWFNDFCIAEGTNSCPSALGPDVTPPDVIPERVEFKFGGNAEAVTDESVYLDAISGF